VRFRKEEEIKKGAAKLRALPIVDAGTGKTAAATNSAPDVKILTSCPSCLQGLSRYNEDADIEADYIVVEIARNALGEDWMVNYVRQANDGGIERVLV
jgi:Fe-S oxidoreductase